MHKKQDSDINHTEIKNKNKTEYSNKINLKL